MTSGEIELARSIFGSAIDYSSVRLVRGKWWPFQPRRSAMAPMGSIYFHPDGGGWSEDFSKESIARQGYFIHELTHVWQTQKGGRFYLPLMRHPLCKYDYRLEPGRPFGRYGLEQQAEIVSHTFMLRRGVGVAGVPPRVQLETILPFRRS